MARYNEINVGRFNRFIQKVTGIKGGPVAPQFSGEVSSFIPFTSGAENRYLESWQLYGNFASVPAAAALVSGVQYRNPNNSNTVAVITRLYFNNNAANTAEVSMGPATLDLGTPNGNNQPWDNRTRLGSGGAGPGAQLIVSSQNSPSVGSLAFIIANLFPPTQNGQTEMILFESHEIPILPGDALRVRMNLANQNINVTTFWRERYLEESERI